MAITTNAAFLIMPMSLPRDESWSLLREFGPVVLANATFLLVWPLAYESLSPDRSAFAVEVGNFRVLTGMQRAVRTTLETLAIVVAVAITGAIGAAASFFIMLGAGEVYRLQAVTTSPQASSRAYVVEGLWGGATGGTDTQVLVLPAEQRWSESRRGLLLWQCEHVDSIRVGWGSERDLRIQVRLMPGSRLTDYETGYARGGFRVTADSLPALLGSPHR